ncbi:hypothetical protein LWI29_035835 [Acer saccharum]|uniref:C2H2-type domain-containing protein n=1 Tax=Acer saccharum TaxID=4024 RepID=A0AA39VD67_ACESA|nr:hypothetical protein LWI29_035835 [Acer saccharum]
MDPERNHCPVCVAIAAQPDATADDIESARVLLSPEEMSAHFQIKHLPYHRLCNICGFGFTSRSVLSMHLESVHKEEIRRLKAENPNMAHKEAFSTAAKNRAHFPPIQYKGDGESGGQEDEKATWNSDSTHDQVKECGWLKIV